MRLPSTAEETVLLVSGSSSGRTVMPLPSIVPSVAPLEILLITLSVWSRFATPREVTLLPEEMPPEPLPTMTLSPPVVFLMLPTLTPVLPRVTLELVKALVLLELRATLALFVIVMSLQARFLIKLFPSIIEEISGGTAVLVLLLLFLLELVFVDDAPGTVNKEDN